MTDSDPDPIDAGAGDPLPVDVRMLLGWATRDPDMAGRVIRNEAGYLIRAIYVPPPLVDETDLNDIEGKDVDEVTPWLESRGWTVHHKKHSPGLSVFTNHTDHGHVLLVANDAKVITAVLNLG